MDQQQTRMGLLATSAAIVALAGVDLLSSTGEWGGQDALLVGFGAVPVAALAAAYLLPGGQ